MNGSKLGIGDIAKLLARPEQVPAVVIKTMPGLSHALGLLPIASRVNLAASLLALDIQTVISRAVVGQADVSKDELMHLLGRCRQIFDETERLFRYGQTDPDASKLADAFGLKGAPPPGPAPAPTNDAPDQVQ